MSPVQDKLSSEESGGREAGRGEGLPLPFVHSVHLPLERRVCVCSSSVSPLAVNIGEPSANHGRDGAPAQVHAGECAQHGLRDNSANRHRGATASWGMPSPAIAPSVCGIVPDDLRDTMSEVRRAILDAERQRRRPRHCRDLQLDGDSASGVRRVFPFRDSPDAAATVYCDQETDGGGWTVFQRRLKLPEMRVDLTDYEGNAKWAKYGLFHLGDASTKYRLQVGRYNGTAGDGFGSGRHNGHPFTTHDNDNDGDGGNCAAKYRGAWWYDKCHISNLNGFPYEGEHESYADGIEWQPWRGYHYSLKTTAMMIRPAF
ncbi:FreD [Penaeus vannamei]|uniref:FreD n=1 Tax=Penaeus vannamei TaxID=6689 RepID=A0A423TMP9_PENVA|nr:FreD [Penaeus vannamei]